MNWWQYLLLANVYLALFYAFYALLLRRETFFQLNRVYLVSTALLSFFIPLIQANWVKNLFITERVHYGIYGSAITIYLKPVQSTPVNVGQLLGGLYLAGVLFLSIRLVWQLIKLNKIIQQPGSAAAFSFFKKIRLNSTDNNGDVITAHEQVHAKQWHSADVLIIEAIMIINWLNPVVYFYRRAIKHIHEFIADSQAIKKADNKADYALLLLSQTFNAPSHQLANHFFNHSLLKQRIIMLQKNRSQRIALIKYGLSAPLFVLMLILSSATANGSKAVNIINKKAELVFLTPAVPATAEAADVPKKIALIRAVSPKAGDNQPAAYSTVKDTVRANNGDGPVFTEVETEPTFVVPGTFGQFLSSNIKYPEAMRKNHIEGRVIITFVVEKDGSLSNFKVLRSPGYGSAEEALRVMALSPKWNPGIQNGRAVRVQYTIPIAFSLGAKGNTTGYNATPVRTDSARLSYIVVDANHHGPQPVIVLDGKVIKNADLRTVVSPADIYSVNVLKDTLETSIYGPGAADGVILITTKKAQETKK
jgi:TonB family protein